MPPFDRSDLRWVQCDVLKGEIVLLAGIYRLGRVFRHSFSPLFWIVHMRRKAFPLNSPTFADTDISAWETSEKTRENAMEVATIIASGHYVLIPDERVDTYRTIAADCARLHRHYMFRGDGGIQGWFVEPRDAMYVKMKYCGIRDDAQAE